jgi:hypothetical protein
VSNSVVFDGSSVPFSIAVGLLNANEFHSKRSSGKAMSVLDQYTRVRVKGRGPPVQLSASSTILVFAGMQRISAKSLASRRLIKTDPFACVDSMGESVANKLVPVGIGEKQLLRVRSP